VKSRLHKGWKGAVYNGLFVGTFNTLPRDGCLFGWHLLAFCSKEGALVQFVKAHAAGSDFVMVMAASVADVKEFSVPRAGSAIGIVGLGPTA
jgi:hypothetical protein